MSQIGDHFRRGKLQVARSIVEELLRVYKGEEAEKELKALWYALNRADAAIKPPRKKRK